MSAWVAPHARPPGPQKSSPNLKIMASSFREQVDWFLDASSLVIRKQLRIAKNVTSYRFIISRLL